MIRKYIEHYVILLAMCCTVIFFGKNTDAEIMKQLPPSIKVDPVFFDLTNYELNLPHICWAKPLNRPPVKTLAIATYRNAMDITELTRRLDMEFNYSLIWSYNKLGYSPDTWRSYEKIPALYTTTIIEELTKKLTQDYELIILGNVEWSLLPANIKQSIMSKVCGGTGLLVSYRPHKTDDLWDKLMEGVKSSDAFVKGLALNGLCSVAEGGKEQIKTGLYGSGRVVFLDWKTDLSAGDLSSCSLVYSPLFSEDSRYLFYYEKEMALLVKAALWSVKYKPDVKITAFSQKKDSPVDLFINIQAATPCTSLLNINARNLFNKTILTKNICQNIKKGNNQIFIPVEFKTDGIYSIDCILKIAGKSVDFASFEINITNQDAAIGDITFDKEMYYLGEDITGCLRYSGAENIMKCILEISDMYGRITAKQSYSVEKNKIVDFSLSPNSVLTTMNLLTAKAILKNGFTIEKNKEFIVDRRDTTIKKFNTVFWPSYPTKPSDAMPYPYIKKMGFDTIFFPHFYRSNIGKLDALCRMQLRNGFDVAPYIYREYAYAQKDIHNPIRKPCLSSPQHIAERRKTLEKYGSLIKKYAPPFYSLGHESYLLHHWKGVDGLDVCFSEYCTDQFRVYLKRMYGSFDELNKEWGSDFGNWREVEPLILQDALANGNLAPWIDHRMHMTKVYCDAAVYGIKTLQKLDKFAYMGIDGFWGWEAFRGYDWYRMAREQNYLAVYHPSNKAVMVADRQLMAFSSEDAFRLFYVGWYPEQNPDEERYSLYWPWMGLFEGYNGFLYWSVQPLANCQVNPNFTPINYMRCVMDEALEIKDGIYELLKGAHKSDGNVIAIHYSNRSNLASSTLKTFNVDTGKLDDAVNPGKGSLSNDMAAMWDMLFADMGFRNSYIATDEIEEGKLNQGDIKVLVLPVSMALTAKEVDEIRSFVKNGGTLIADVLPGIMDAHGRRVDNPKLDELFGVKTKGWFNHLAEKATMENSKDFVVETYDDLTPQTANISLVYHGHDFYTVNSFHKGKALLANTTFLSYLEMRKNGTNNSFKSAILDWFKKCTLVPELTLKTRKGDLIASSKIYKYIDGASVYLGITKDPNFTDGAAEEYLLKLPGKRHVYNVREGKCLGFTDSIQSTISSAKSQLFALMPYKVTKLNVDIKMQQIIQGDSLVCKIYLETDGSIVGHHIVRVEITDPDSEKLRHLTQTVELHNGRAGIIIPTAFNDKTGKWNVLFTDISTGINRKVSYRLSD